jgi:RND family efflux transporter MFP subunit
MMPLRTQRAVAPSRIALVLFVSVALSACEQNSFVPPPPPKVEVGLPVQKSITRYLEATGNTAPIKNVDLVARVQGFLQSINYQDGTFVKQGTTLFTIEPETYKLKLEQAQAAEAGAQASLKQAEADFKRQSDLVQRQAVSQATLDTSTSTRDNAQANLQQAQVNTRIAAVNYGYTDVVAPFDGIVTAHLVSVGELVGASSPTQLATIVALDPIYVNFNVNEQDVLRIRAEARRRGLTASDLTSLPVEVELQTESGYPHKGKLNYASPTINQSTGTLAVRWHPAQCRSNSAARILCSSPRSRPTGSGRAAGSRHRAGQRSGRTIRAGRERRQCRRAAQSADRAARWRAARDRKRVEAR